MTFSANLGFLWRELSLTEAIRAAADAGFVAVECHWPFDTPAPQVKAALGDTGLRMMSLNTSPGDLQAGEFGLAALPGREADARAAIDTALGYAAAIGAGQIHVMAGIAAGGSARRCFIANLRYATEQADRLGLGILIEPINTRDVPGYFLHTTDQAEQIMEAVAASNLRLMFDCYHVQIMQGDVTRRLAALLDRIGHVQIASVPARAEPDRGELDYRHVLSRLRELGYRAPVGAEYRPAADTAAGLGWMQTLSAI